MSGWLKTLAPPTFEDEEKTRIAGLLNLMLLSSMAFAVLYGVLAPILYAQPLPVLISASVVLPLWFVAWLLLRRGSVKSGGLVFLSVLWVIVACMAFLYGGVMSMPATTFVTIIFAAGLLLGVRAGLGFAGLSLLASLGMLWVETRGLVSLPLVQVTPGMNWLGLVTNVMLALLLLVSAANNIRGALERARRQERALAKSNEELQLEIARRERIEKALRESEEKYRTILQNIEDGYFEVDLAGNLEFCNDALCQIIGYPPSELIGMNNRQYMDSENASRVYRTFNRVYRTGEPSRSFDWALIRQDGTQRLVDTSVSLITRADGEAIGFRGIARDVTERRQAEEALRKSEEWLRAIVEGIHALLAHVDRRGRFVYVNNAAARAVGCRPEELVGRLCLRFVHPQDRGKFAQVGREQMREKRQSAKLEFRAMDGQGNSRWLSLVANPMLEKGHLVGYMGVAVDISDRMQTEASLRQRTLELQARNEELDAFAHTVAHDLQDPLSLVVGFADVLREAHGTMSGEEVGRYLQIVVENGFRMSRIIDELLLLAQLRMVEVQTEVLDMAPIVAAALERLVYPWRDQNLEISLPDAYPLAVGYGPWVEEVWANYFSNALKYGGQPPRITVSARVEAEGMVRFAVQDNGPGLAPEEQAHLFAPFTRLSNVQVKGHGLGLSIVRRVVENLGGTVGVESEGLPGEGCVFWFTLPGVIQDQNLANEIPAR